MRLPSFTPPSIPPPASHTSPHCTRRTLLHRLASLSVVPSLLLLPDLAHADRTGKFSSRLTARRRYLPRVTRGIAAILSAARLERDAPPVADTMDDLLPALRLFASAGFGEGAASLPTRAKLREALETIARAAPGAAAQDEMEMRRLVDALRMYVEAAEIGDAVPALTGEGGSGF